LKRETFFEDKVVIVTGASSGIGKALALYLSRLKAKVVLAARNEVKLFELTNQINASGNEAIFVRTDISIKSDVIHLINTTTEKWGKIDILISNAGQYIQGYLDDTEEELFRKSFDVNFYGSFYAVKEIMPVMKGQNAGHIIFINSLDSKKGIVGDGPYVAAKSALDGFADVLRQEVSNTGIRVISVYLGRVDTPMIEDLRVPWISSKMSVQKVVGAIIKGIIKSKPIIVVPKTSYLLGALNNLSPRLLDWFYKKLRVEGVKNQ